MNENIIKQIIELENKYKCNDYNGAKGEKCNYKVIKGTIPILLLREQKILGGTK